MLAVFQQLLGLPRFARQLPVGAQEPVEAQPDAEPIAKPEEPPVQTQTE